MIETLLDNKPLGLEFYKRLVCASLSRLAVAPVTVESMRIMSNAIINFTLHEQSKAARRGCLKFIQKNKAIQTPACLTFTIRGSIPHLVPDNLTDQPIQAIQVSLEHL